MPILENEGVNEHDGAHLNKCHRDTCHRHIVYIYIVYICIPV